MERFSAGSMDISMYIYSREYCLLTLRVGVPVCRKQQRAGSWSDPHHLSPVIWPLIFIGLWIYGTCIHVTTCQDKYPDNTAEYFVSFGLDVGTGITCLCPATASWLLEVFMVFPAQQFPNTLGLCSRSVLPHLWLWGLARYHCVWYILQHIYRTHHLSSWHG